MKSPLGKKEVKVFCYKCEEYGYWGYGTAKNSRGTRYQINYVRHYSSQEYYAKKDRYRSRKGNSNRKSRSNGQVRCYIPKVELCPSINREYYIACCYIASREDGKLYYDRFGKRKLTRLD